MFSSWHPAPGQEMPIGELAAQYAALSLLQEDLDKLRPLPQEAVKNLHDDMVVRYTYHSNAIEGNTLTFISTMKTEVLPMKVSSSSLLILLQESMRRSPQPM